MIKHTKGPWTPAIYEVTSSMLERLKLKQFAVCTNDDPSNPKGTLIALCGDCDPEDLENSSQSLADAYLIAAAPTLLKGLKLAIMEFERISYQKKCDPEILKDLKRAVAMAEGSKEEL